MQREQVVFSQSQINSVLSELDYPFWLLAALMAGSGLRLSEALRLRVKDIDFQIDAIIIRDNKGGNDRVVAIPNNTTQALKKQIGLARCLHDKDLAEGHGHTVLPFSIARKYGHKYGLASNEFEWQFVFPKSSRSLGPRSGVISRYHLPEQMVQRAVRSAITQANNAGANINQSACCDTFRLSYIAGTQEEQNPDCSAEQKQFSYNRLSATQNYTHKLQRSNLTVVMPLKRSLKLA